MWLWYLLVVCALSTGLSVCLSASLSFCFSLCHTHAHTRTRTHTHTHTHTHTCTHLIHPVEEHGISGHDDAVVSSAEPLRSLVVIAEHDVGAVVLVESESRRLQSKAP